MFVADRKYEGPFASDKGHSVKSLGDEGPSLILDPPLAGFAHGPASLTSSTAQPGGALQLVTVTKAYTTLSFPDMPLLAILNVHFVPEPGTLLLLGFGVASLALHGRRKRGR